MYSDPKLNQNLSNHVLNLNLTIGAKVFIRSSDIHLWNAEPDHKEGRVWVGAVWVESHTMFSRSKPTQCVWTGT